MVRYYTSVPKKTHLVIASDSDEIGGAWQSQKIVEPVPNTVRNLVFEFPRFTRDRFAPRNDSSFCTFTLVIEEKKC